MFRKMRRVKRELSTEVAKELLRQNRRAAFCVNGDEGYPYAIPINFYYEESENKIYFHCAGAGHKIDAVKANDKVCFTTWDDGVLEDGDWAYYVSSCVVFGRAKLVEDRAVALEKIRKFALKYYPTEEEADEEIQRDFDRVQMMEITIEQITGKRIHEK